MNKLLLELENQAFDAYSQGDLITAVSLYKNILEIQHDFEHGGIWFQLGSCYEELGQIELAKKSYEKSLAQDPDDYIKLCAYGPLLLQSEDYQGAYKIYNYETINSMDTNDTLLALNELIKKNNMQQPDIDTY